MYKYSLIVFFSLIFSTVVLSQETDEKLAVQYFSDGEFEKAAALFEKLYQNKPSTYYFNYLINAYVEGKKFSDAEKFIKKLMRQEKDNVKLKVDLGYIYKRAGDDNKAAKEFDDALLKGVDDKNQIINLANAFLVRNEQGYAIKTYLKGKNNSRLNYTFGLELGSLYERQLRYDEMIKEYLDLLEFNTNDYLAIVQNILQSSLSVDPEGIKSNALKTELLRRIQANPGQSFYSKMLLWYAVQQKDFDMAFVQAKSIDKRLKQNGIEVYQLGELALSNEVYEIAVKCFEYIIDKGEDNYFYMDSRVNLLHAEYLNTIKLYNFNKNDLDVLEAKYYAVIKDYGKNQLTLPLIKDLSYLQAFYMDKPDKATELLNDVIILAGIPPALTAECKLLLADILLMTGDVWEATLLYSQIEKALKNDPLASEAKFRNARLSYYINEFDWAKAQLNVLKASTSKLIANDAMELSLLISDNVGEDSSYVPLSMYAKADLLSFQNKDDDALLLLDSIINEFPGHLIIDDVLYKEANIAIKKMKFNVADSLLNLIVEKHSNSVFADDALFKRATLYETKFNNSSKAMELYQELLLKYPASTYTVEARKNYRKLRGDLIN